MISKYSISIVLAAALTIIASPYSDARPTDQDKARQNMKSGQSKPLAELRRIVENHMGSKSIGSKFDSRKNIYRFKFLQRDKKTQKSRVIFVYVDARSGAIINQR